MIKREQRVVRSGDAELATEAFGTGERGTILLVMGATASMVVWPVRLCEVLAAGGYRVIRFDHRDTGQSTTNAPGDVRYTLDDLSADLAAVLDGHGVARAHFVGMSLGGYLSQILALRQPERFSSLTLYASEPLGGAEEPLPGIDDKFMEHFATIGELDWSDRAAVAATMMRSAELSTGSAHPFDRAAVQAEIDATLDRAKNIVSAFNHAQMSHELDPGLKAADIRVPVLVIHGEEDPILPLPNGQALARLIPGAELKVLKGTGHELHPLDLPAIADAILGFAARH